MAKFSKANSKGFTLIELLIVIIIIGILAAIAFVAFSGTTNKANESAAQSTLATAKNKLAEYNADQGYYPATKAVFVTWLQSAAGGNNQNFTATTGNGFNSTAQGASYVYTATPASCDNSATDCTGYTLTADATIWGDSNTADNITVSN